ncbi:MAG TPA: helix-turn-helix domain-containing protein [Pseudonocardia sp.]|jgi:transcriptional regulator with XRE-family HTH domain|nr:helix-turn-helix domain-containing protein [Pseudonocardia sp.]
MTLLLREAIGGSLRRARTTRRRTLREVSHQARVSLGYLSEVERGRKEASSELLAAICDALEFPLPDLLAEVSDAMRPVPAMQPLVPIGTRHTELRRATAVPQSVSAGAPATPLVSVAA